MVYRLYVEKKEGLTAEAQSLKNEINNLLMIKSLTELRVINRYDVENIDKDLFDYAKTTVFSEPQLDNISDELPDTSDCIVFATEYLPGQFDQRADSAAQCIQLISQCERPTVRTAKVFLLYGNVTEEELNVIKNFIINPVESREAQLETYDSLAFECEIPEGVETLTGFCKLDKAGLAEFVEKYGLAMDEDDIAFCQNYFISEDRDPTITEIRMIDTYWSDHCRHTTFLTNIDNVTFCDELLEGAYNRYLSTREAMGRSDRPKSLMDIATLAAKFLRAEGKLPNLDESEEINACTVKIKVEINGKEEDWLLLFKNETHNHPTEIEPFGGAATCIGGAIRDPLSGRSYVYGAMRVTGASDPTVPVADTIEGKLSQRKIVTTAAAGYSSYGNQIGLATGIVDELYHKGYMAKRMEIGAVIAAAPAENVRREVPEAGDVVILLGGKTGRDGCGGATGSSKSHTLSSIETCSAEVQKGNAPEERKLQRLFRNKEASQLIKRCNDFGAGGVSVAIGELADGLRINLNAVPKKYEGLDGTELAISESQERMAVVVEKKDVERFKELAAEENLEATLVAEVTKEPRLVMTWGDKAIVNLSREFLNSNGAQKHIDIAPAAPEAFEKTVGESFTENMKALVSDLNVCSKRGLSERFDSTIGAGTVLMPFGGKFQRTPIQAMVNKVSVEKKHTDTCSFMSWGYNPYLAEKSPYHGAYLAVVESLSKLVATGGKLQGAYLTFQEYFESPRTDAKRWGKPLSALLGSFDAQIDYEIASIGGKDSMSGSFEDIDVPPTLVSFAVTTGKVGEVISPEFKKAGSKVVLLAPEYTENGIPSKESQKAVFDKIAELNSEGKILSAYTLGFGGIAEAVYKMCIGNGIGFKFAEGTDMKSLFDVNYGAFVLEVTEDTVVGTLLGITTETEAITCGGDTVVLETLENLYEGKLEDVYSCNIDQGNREIPTLSFTERNTSAPAIKVAKPKVLIPVFPGTNCEYDSAKVMRDAGADAEIIVIKNLTPQAVTESVDYFANKLRDAQMVFIPGGFSGGDEPDGSGKFITAFFRNQAVTEQVHELLKNRDGLMCGICNGFQALIKLGLVPYGEIIDTDENCPTLTYNTISRHQSKLVNVRVASTLSPWLKNSEVGDTYLTAISHGEGRFLASDELIEKLIANGQVATQYVDLNGNATADVQFNPNNSAYAIEGITSPDGRVFGKMGHCERVGNGLYKNVPGNSDMGIFRSAVEYFK